MASSAGSLLSLVLGKGCDSNLDTYGFLAWVVLVLCCFYLVARLKLCQCSDLAARLSPEFARVTVLAAARSWEQQTRG
eukprot:s5974_g9.t1